MLLYIWYIRYNFQKGLGKALTVPKKVMKVSKKFLAIIMIFALIFPCASFETQAAKAVSVTLGVKENYKLSVKPAKNTNIGNDTVIALKSDKVTALKKGKSTLDYTDKNGKKYSFVFTVKSAPASISLPKKKTVFDTETISLKYTLSKGSAGKVTFSTSNPRVATVDKNGVVFAKHKGSVTISAKTYNGKKAKCKLTVKQGVRTMAMSKDRLTLGKTSSAKLSVQVNSGAVCDSYKWKTSNKKVVTVKGKGTKATVTAKKPGKAIVTCVADSGVKATCEVVVTKTTTSDSIKKQINAQPLYPQKPAMLLLINWLKKSLKRYLRVRKQITIS